MSIDVAPKKRPLTDRVAEEIRALMARQRMSGRELARRLNVSASWVNYRLTGSQPIDVNDLELIAEALGVDAAELLPGRHIVRYSNKPPTDMSQKPATRRPRARRPRDSRPGGHPPRTRLLALAHS